MRRGLSRLAATYGAVALLALVVPTVGSAVTLDPIGTYSLPTYVTSDPNDPDRIFVVEQGSPAPTTAPSRIRLTTGGVTTTTFLDLSSIVLPGGERGLLSMAFAPDYGTTGRFYVYYTGSEDDASHDPGDIHVDEFTASGDTADLSTRHEILTIPHPAGNHNGGQLQFGPDGYLYISTGDGGGGDDPDENAQNKGSLLGKILRIDPTPGGGYEVPSDNPFVGEVGARPEVWSYGLRNPWRFSFDRTTGALVIGDVGQGAREEIDYEPQSVGGGRGVNFGWDCREGLIDHPIDPSPLCAGTTASDFTDPVFDYAHDEECSITGGYVVRDPNLTELLGRYVYADFCASELHSIQLCKPTAVDDRDEGISFGNPTSFGEDADGRIYIASRNGPVSRFEHSSSASPAECPSGPSPPPPPPPPPEDQKAPGVSPAGDEKQDLAGSRRIELTFTSDEAATLEVGGEVTAGSSKKRLFGLRTKHRSLKAAVGMRVSWRLNRRRARRVRRLLRHPRKRVTASFAGTATDGSGNAAPLERRIRLTSG